MFRITRTTAIALATIGSLASTALVSTSASAFYGGRGGYSGHLSSGPSHANSHNAAMIRRPGPPVVFPHPRPPHWHWHYGWHHHYWVAPVVATDYVATTGRCTCLTKDYLQDGSVVFRDVCTKEEAMAPSAERQASEEQSNPQPQAH
jgi:hypothetical protein